METSSRMYRWDIGHGRRHSSSSIPPCLFMPWECKADPFACFCKQKWLASEVQTAGAEVPLLIPRLRVSQRGELPPRRAVLLFVPPLYSPGSRVVKGGTGLWNS